jgi:hypothetical protein
MLEVRPGLNIMIFETFSGWKCGSAVAEFSWWPPSEILQASMASIFILNEFPPEQILTI